MFLKELELVNMFQELWHIIRSSKNMSQEFQLQVFLENIILTL